MTDANAPYQVMPPLSADEYAALKADVAARGVQVPVEYDEQNNVLDGHHRIKICQELGIAQWPRLVRYGLTDAEKRNHARRLNLERRHLSAEQRRQEIERELRERPEASDRAIAGGLGVDHKTVGKVRDGMESTGEIPQLDEREGRDGRSRRIVQFVPSTPGEESGVTLSAQALAMRNKEQVPAQLPGGARSIMGSRQEPDNSLDYFPTPPWATRALVEHALRKIGIKDIKTAWEPACGEGHIAEVLTEYGATVVASDIFDYGYGEALVDFLADDPRPEMPQVDWIITNPPFDDKAVTFALRAIERARIGVALFVRWQWIESVGRYENLFLPFPPRIICPFAERVPLHKGRWEPDGATATAYCWVVWTPHHVGPTILSWIPPGRRKALTRPDDEQRFTAHPVIRRGTLDHLVDDNGMVRVDDTCLVAAEFVTDRERVELLARQQLPPHDPKTGEIIDPDEIDGFTCEGTSDGARLCTGCWDDSGHDVDRDNSIPEGEPICWVLVSPEHDEWDAYCRRCARARAAERYTDDGAIIESEISSQAATSAACPADATSQNSAPKLGPAEQRDDRGQDGEGQEPAPGHVERVGGAGSSSDGLDIPDFLRRHPEGGAAA